MVWIDCYKKRAGLGSRCDSLPRGSKVEAPWAIALKLGIRDDCLVSAANAEVAVSTDVGSHLLECAALNTVWAAHGLGAGSRCKAWKVRFGHQSSFGVEEFCHSKCWESVRFWLRIRGLTVKLPQVAFLMDGLAVLIGLAELQFHGLVTDRTSGKGGAAREARVRSCWFGCAH
jgi:hypothetical protein